MGILEDIDKMELADDVKATLRKSALADLRSSRRSEVEKEIADLQALFSDKDGKIDPNAIGVLKFTRRVLLSDDHEPGLVLLTDDELNLSDDERTGSREQEEVTTAGVLRTFLSLLPKTEDGRISLSDVVPESNDDGRPSSGNEDTKAQKSEGAKKRLGEITGFSTPRTRNRYNGGQRVVGGAS